MKNVIILCCWMIVSLNGMAQIYFEKGYFINNKNEKVNCLIKNTDWKSSPTKFEYKINEDAIIQNEDIKNVKEFSVEDDFVHRRFEVDLDYSDTDLENLSLRKEPEFRRKTVFLDLLVAGEAKLYEYVEGNLRRYFYQKENEEPVPLVYKRYRIDQDKIGFNNSFKVQLSKNFECKDFAYQYLKDIQYEKKFLTNFFIKYNECRNAAVTNYVNTPDRKLLNFSIRPGINSSSLYLHYISPVADSIQFGRQTNFRVGLEMEYYLPFNKNKWSIIVEPTYQFYNGETGEIPSPEPFEPGPEQLDLTYTSIEIPVGLRYSFYLNDQTRAYISGAFAFDFPFSSSMIIFQKNPDLTIRSDNNLIFGAGINLNRQFTLEARYSLQRDLLGQYIRWFVGYESINLIIGYTFFKK